MGSFGFFFLFGWRVFLLLFDLVLVWFFFFAVDVGLGEGSCCFGAFFSWLAWLGFFGFLPAAIQALNLYLKCSLYFPQVITYFQ